MKIFQFMNKDVDIYTQCMQKGVVERLPPGVDYELLKEDPYNCVIYNDDPRSPSEEIRVRLAIDNPDMVWLDSDIAIKEWPDFSKKGKPFFMGLQGWFAGEYGFYVNGCIDFFKDILDEYHHKCTNRDNYWLQGAVNRRLNDIYIIPQDKLIHCLFNGGYKMDEKKGDGYTITKDNDKYKLDFSF